MPYVMVPVPAEHEREFGQWLLARSLQARLSEWQDGAIEAAYADQDPRAQVLMGILAGQDELAVPATELAELAQMDVEEVVELMTVVCQYGFERHLAPLVMQQRDGGDSAELRSYLMGQEVRRTIRLLLAG
jgi:hypothetical protein